MTLFTRFLRHGALALSLAVFSNAAWAAQTGKVQVSVLEIRMAPDPGAEVFAEVKRGTLLRISSKTKEGWFKVLVPGTENSKARYGWVPGDSVLAFELEEERRLHHVQAGETKYEVDDELDKPSQWSIAGLMQLTSVTPRDVQGLSGVDNSRVTLTKFAGEIILHPEQKYGFALHFVPLAAQQSNDVTGVGYDVSAPLVTAFAEYYPLVTDINRIGFGLGFGGALINLKVTRADPAGGANLSAKQDFAAMAISGRVTLRQNLGTHFGLIGHAGYRWLNQKKLSITQSTTTLQLSGIFLEAGLFIEF